ncbi:hypothetical protein ACO0TC_19165 [Pseudomonas aeruginosa]|uniref:hypothetical protein n=1 Tax=Pseudomonas TaxID=286 RepID=UPI001FFC86C4|nr:hypothetical protein [Pseudomonas sp. PNPG3]MCK2119862.1 hypothetical protein [Pseudomonas sp. PNPG3]HEP8866446.1 hypothetical protein [Pseudomonas aeruginosa]
MAVTDERAIVVADALNSFITIAENSGAEIKRQADEVKRGAAAVADATSKLQQRVDGIDSTVEKAIDRNLSESVTHASKVITKALESANGAAGRAAKQLNQAAGEVAEKLFWAGAIGGLLGGVAGGLAVFFAMRLL